MRPMYRPEGCCAVHSGELQQEVWKLLCAWAGLLLSVESHAEAKIVVLSLLSIMSSQLGSWLNDFGS